MIGHSYCLFVNVFSYTADAFEVVVAPAAVAAAAAYDGDREWRRSNNYKKNIKSTKSNSTSIWTYLIL